MNGIRAWAEVDLNAIWHNIQEMRKLLSRDCRIMAVVKAEAYGHGAAPVSLYLERKGIRDFAVASLSEGRALREAGIFGRILILGYTPPEKAKEIRQYKLTQAIVDEDHGEALKKQGIPLSVQIKIDTGMHRLGISWDRKEALLSLFSQPLFSVEGIFSHLCVSDSLKKEDRDYTEMQAKRFGEILAYLSEQGISYGDAHLLASGGILNLPKACFSMVRPGILLYGAYSSPSMEFRHGIEKRPALSLRARVASIRSLWPGESAGYGRCFRAEGKRRIASVSIGYGDGLPGSFRQGRVLLHGKYAPVAGRICMDQMLIDVTEIPEAAPGDVVTIIGKDKEEFQSAEEVARTCGMISNELLSGLGSRLERYYQEQE